MRSAQVEEGRVGRRRTAFEGCLGGGVGAEFRGSVVGERGRGRADFEALSSFLLWFCLQG